MGENGAHLERNTKTISSLRDPAGNGVGIGISVLSSEITHSEIVTEAVRRCPDYGYGSSIGQSYAFVNDEKGCRKNDRNAEEVSAR